MVAIVADHRTVELDRQIDHTSVDKSTECQREPVRIASSSARAAAALGSFA